MSKHSAFSGSEICSIFTSKLACCIKLVNVMKLSCCNDVKKLCKG